MCAALGRCFDKDAAVAMDRFCKLREWFSRLIQGPSPMVPKWDEICSGRTPAFANVAPSPQRGTKISGEFQKGGLSALNGRQFKTSQGSGWLSLVYHHRHQRAPTMSFGWRQFHGFLSLQNPVSANHTVRLAGRASPQSVPRTRYNAIALKSACETCKNQLPTKSRTFGIAPEKFVYVNRQSKRG